VEFLLNLIAAQYLLFVCNDRGDSETAVFLGVFGRVEQIEVHRTMINAIPTFRLPSSRRKLKPRTEIPLDNGYPGPSPRLC